VFRIFGWVGSAILIVPAAFVGISAVLERTGFPAAAAVEESPVLTLRESDYAAASAWDKQERAEFVNACEHNKLSVEERAAPSTKMIIMCRCLASEMDNKTTRLDRLALTYGFEQDESKIKGLLRAGEAHRLRKSDLDKAERRLEPVLAQCVAR
jgi:hypothetical protein